MAAKNVIIALLALASCAYGQTRALFVNTNGTVQWGITLRFDGPLDFTDNGFAATTRSNLSLGLPALTNTSNVGLLSALGGMTTNGNASGLTNFPAFLLTTNGSAGGLTNFPASLLRTNGDAAGLTNFPAFLLRTNGDGSGLTNLPNADLGSATGILPLANGGTGTNSAAGARTALELGTAATNDATAFQPANTNLTALAGGDGSSLTNVTITDASTLTNFPAELLRTNGDASGLTNFPPAVLLTNGNAGGLTNFPAELLRTNGDASGLTGVATYPAFSNNAGKVLAVATNEAGVEWLPVSNTVTDASLLTNFPASLLTTNGNAAGLTNFPAELLRTNGDAAALTNFPTLNQNTTGTASNVTGVVAVANGGTGASDASNARVNLLPSYTGNENKVLALNSNATDIVWAVDGGGTPDVSTATGVLPVANGGSGATTGAGALTNFGVFASNSGLFITTAANVYPNFATVIGVGATNANGGAGNTVLGYGAAGSTDSTDLGGVAVGRGAFTESDGTAVGNSARASGTLGIALGVRAVATNGVQIGAGTNSTSSTIQFRNAGLVDTNEWSALANSTTFGHYLMAAPTNGTNGQVLALNSNATAVIWTNSAGDGTPDVSTATGVLPVANGGTGATNGQTALTNLGVFVGSAVALTTATNNTTTQSIAIGAGARNVSGANTVVGTDATSDDGSGLGGVSIGRNAVSSNSAVAIGYSTYSAVFGAAIGYNAEATGQGGAIGYNTIANNGGAIGSSAEAIRGFAGGQDAHASATNSSQIGTGTNSTDNTIQFLSAGTVDTNEWSRIAALSTYPTTNISVVGTNNTNTLVFSNGILVEVQ